MLINFLPHREWALARNRQNFVTVLVMSALLGLVLAMVGRVWLEHKLTVAMAANSSLKKEISAVDGLLKIKDQVKEDIEKLRLRETTLQAFQFDRKLSALWLQAVAENLPDGLYLTALKKKGDNIYIHGVGRSNGEVFELLRQVASHGQWFAQVELIEVTDTPSKLGALELSGTPFAMRARLKIPNGNDDANAEQLSDAP
jgi:type IV pilus assembly protein PilN